MLNTSKELIEDASYINQKVVKQNIGKVGNHYYLIIPILSNKNNMDLTLFSQNSIRHLNKLRFINQNLNDFSNLILKGVVLFYFIALLVLCFKFSFLKGILILSPTLISICMTLGIISFFYEALNLFHILGIVLMIALGLDFSFFYFFNRKKSNTVGRAVSLSTLTTLSSFGVLSMSRTHAISSFGVVVLLGMVFCWFLVPSIAGEKLNE